MADSPESPRRGLYVVTETGGPEAPPEYTDGFLSREFSEDEESQWEREQACIDLRESPTHDSHVDDHEQRRAADQRRFRPWFCIAVFLSCAAVFLMELGKNDWSLAPLEENPLVGPDHFTLIDSGAKVSRLITEESEYWRLIAPVFLHAGVVHLLFNMLGVLQLGVPIEREFGWYRIAPVYLLGGVFGMVASTIFLPSLISVGASSAVFALLGASWADLWNQWDQIDNRCCMLTSMLISTVLNLALGLLPYLDNFAHVGGFVMGLTVGLLVLSRRDPLTGQGGMGHLNVRQACGMCVGATFGIALWAAGLLTLFMSLPADRWCGWCDVISCLPTEWWDCDADIACTGYSTSNSSHIVCPDGRSFDAAESYSATLCNTLCE